uniref:Uncharacterized protein n=1 Tax=Oryza sativa subsp. japonica TaxID=39947 RepID=Q5JND0_ORYSJ|nr:hypothetical protein [Oryza sativa Japonica Group]
MATSLEEGTAAEKGWGRRGRRWKRTEVEEGGLYIDRIGLVVDAAGEGAAAHVTENRPQQQRVVIVAEINSRAPPPPSLAGWLEGVTQLLATRSATVGHHKTQARYAPATNTGPPPASIPAASAPPPAPHRPPVPPPTAGPPSPMTIPLSPANSPFFPPLSPSYPSHLTHPRTLIRRPTPEFGLSPAPEKERSSSELEKK